MAMLTATPRYSAITPRAKRTAPELTSETTMAEAQPASSMWPESLSPMMTAANRIPTTASATPSMLTRRSIRVPPVMTIRQ